MKHRVIYTLAGVLLLTALTWLWLKTRSLDPDAQAQTESALRELRSLDRTINQDVLRARYQLVDSYHPVLVSYRRIEELEAVIAAPPTYLDNGARQRWLDAVAAYRSAATAKQNRIETFKYRSADLKELLSYLPGAGTGVANAASEAGDEALAQRVNEVLQLTLLYNLTSDEKYAPAISGELDALSTTAEQASSPGVKRRVRTLVLNIRRLLKVKPEVDRQLVAIFETPVTQHEEAVAKVYYTGYAVAARNTNHYRMVLYGVSLALLGLVAYGVGQLQRSARALALANEKLEERVAERTRELAARNLEMRVVLDNVEQALLTVDLDGSISRERSAAFDRWFPNAAAGTRLWDVFRDVDASVASWIELGWASLREALMPQDVVLDQLPRQVASAGRHYELAYLPIGEHGDVEKILLVVSDVTERVQRTLWEAEQQELGAVLQQIAQDRPGFLEFFSESERLVSSALADAEPASALRSIHTLKGNTALFGMSSLSALCHQLETKVVERGEALDTADRQRLSDAWASFTKKVRTFFGADDERIQLSRVELQGLERAVADGVDRSSLRKLVRQLAREPAERRLRRIADQAQGLAARLGKAHPDVIVEANDARLEATRWAPFWSAFVHVVRNALEHGIEATEERLASGKPATGRLWLRTRPEGDRIVVELEDDGRGIDWNIIRARAQELGVAAETEADLARILVAGGVSTRRNVTEYSGRGAGVSAIHQACVDLGGTLTMLTKPGQGTTFRFVIPSDDAALSVSARI